MRPGAEAGHRCRVAVAGDVIPLRRFMREGTPRAGFAAMHAELSDADVVFGDLEVPLSRRGSPWEKLVTFRADPEIAQDVYAAGFNVLSLANNQTLNYGREALCDTMEALDSVGIVYVGAGRTISEALRPRILHAKGLSVAFLAATCLAPAGWSATDTRSGLATVPVRTAIEIDARRESEEPGVAPRVRTWIADEDLASLLSAVATARRAADVVLVSIHWGVGTTHERADYQQALARALVEAGADVVLGNHPPALQGFEVISGRLVSYSLGTFVRQQPQSGLGGELDDFYARMPRESGLLTIDVSRSGVDGARVLPGVLDDDGVCVAPPPERCRAIVEQMIRRSFDLEPYTVHREGHLTISVRAPAAGASAR